jgi:hypothetical protein
MILPPVILNKCLLQGLCLKNTHKEKDDKTSRIAVINLMGEYGDMNLLRSDISAVHSTSVSEPIPNTARMLALAAKFERKG